MKRFGRELRGPERCAYCGGDHRTTEHPDDAKGFIERRAASAKPATEEHDPTGHYGVKLRPGREGWGGASPEVAAVVLAADRVVDLDHRAIIPWTRHGFIDSPELAALRRAVLALREKREEEVGAALNA